MQYEICKNASQMYNSMLGAEQYNSPAMTLLMCLFSASEDCKASKYKKGVYLARAKRQMQSVYKILQESFDKTSLKKLYENESVVKSLQVIEECEDKDLVLLALQSLKYIKDHSV